MMAVASAVSKNPGELIRGHAPVRGKALWSLAKRWKCVPSDTTWSLIARLIVGAFDVDIQHWMGNSFNRLRETDVGTAFAEWAEGNPAAFETLLRVTSAAARQLPKDDNLLMETVYTQLGRLPVEVERAVRNGAPRFVNTSERDAESFFKKYAGALQDLADEDLAKIAILKRSRLDKWVCSPAPIRPHLLARWSKEDAGKAEGKARSTATWKELDHTIAEKVRAVNQRLKDQEAERKAEELKLSRLQRIKRAIW
jgi:hypothetical protein